MCRWRSCAEKVHLMRWWSKKGNRPFVVALLILIAYRVHFMVVLVAINSAALQRTRERLESRKLFIPEMKPREVETNDDNIFMSLSTNKVLSCIPS